jgi:hypothetical protein
MRHFEPDYQPAYTHPGKPAPGFTFDFAPPNNGSPTSSSSPTVIVVDDSPGPSASASSSLSSHNDDPNTILVCARCMDALVTGDSMTGIEYARRKLWGLRCGHLLDGKCIEEIMKPSVPTVDTEEILNPADVKGKGKDRMSTLEPPRLDKGKGKAIDQAPPELNARLDFSSQPESNSIRSRLRSRHSTSHAADIFSSPPRVIRPLPNRWSLKGKSKGKGKMKAFFVEAEHHWKCPVVGCAKVHTSLLVEGKWVMDDKAGAIGVYV